VTVPVATSIFTSALFIWSSSRSACTPCRTRAVIDADHVAGERHPPLIITGARTTGATRDVDLADRPM